MKTTLSQPEMLRQWRLRRLYEPLRNDCAVTRTDGIDLDAILLTEMENWYRGLLLTAPADLLVTDDIASSAAMTADSDRTVTIPLDADICRVVEVRLSSWSRPATVIIDPCCPLALSQRHRFTRGGASQPVVLFMPGQLTLFCVPPRSRLTSLIVVRRPQEGTYALDTAALALITPCLTVS